MPKIYGDLRCDIDLERVRCLRCNYSWKPDNATLNSMALDKRVSCPMCRLLKGHRPGEVIDHIKGLTISVDVLNMPIERLTDRNYLDIEIPITCSRCNSTIKVKNKDFTNFLENPECRCDIVQRERAKRQPLQKKAEAEERAERAERVERAEALKAEALKKQSKLTMSKPVTTSKPVTLQEPAKPAQMKPKTQELRGYAKIEKVVTDNIGKVYNRAVIISGIDTDKQEFTIQCTKCGAERHLPLRILTSNEKRNSEMRCIHCTKTPKKKSNTSVAGLSTKYLGKVYNGFKIIKVYCEDEVTKCDVQCMSNTRREIVEGKVIEKAGHITYGVNFGDVINGHIQCEKCGKLPLSQDSRLLGAIDCQYFKDRNKLGENGYNSSSIKGLRCGEVYTTEGSICDYCGRKDRCQLRDSLTTKFSYIRSLADSKDNQKVALNDVMAKYPTIYSSRIKGASEIKADLTRGIMIFRDAYRGRDGELYKFCKCYIHGTELVLAESEIDKFDHHQCNEVKNPYMRFFELEPYYLLEKVDKGKK